MSKTVILAAGIFIFGSNTAYGFDNIEIPRSEVPLAAMETAVHYAPSLIFTRYAYEDEDGLRIYEFEAQDANGHHIELDILADGTLQEIELEITWDEVPIAVQIELYLQNPDFKPKFIEASVRPDGTTVYEFEGTVKGEFTDIEILESGVAITLHASG